MSIERDPFPVDAFAMLASAEENNWWFKSRNQLIIWTLQTKVKPFKDYLEIGCGTGFVLAGVRNAFGHVRFTATEYFEEGLNFARRRVPDAKFERLDAVQMTDIESYDLIGAFDVIEHIEQDEIVIQNLARAIRPGGSVVITVPQHMWLWSPVDENACHVRRYSRSELSEKLHNSKLEIDFMTSFVTLLLPLMWISRLRSRAINNKEDNELHLPRLLNIALGIVMKAEFFLISNGIPMLFGGSLLVVARKVR